MKDLKGKTVLVTGAAQGIGRKLAVGLSRHNARLVLTDVKERELGEAADEIKARGGQAHTFVVDVTNQEAILDVRRKIHGTLGRIDMLVNNAGIVFGGPFLETPFAKHALTYGVNTVGLVGMTHAFLPDLIAQPRGHLVNIASASGLVGLPDGATYASSKWAVIGFSESIRLELSAMRHHNVVVTTVCPSYIGTGMFAGVKPPLLTPELKPDALVGKMIDAILNDELFVLEPAMVKLVPFLRGVLPIGIFDRVAEVFGVTTSMRSWRGHGS